jgi:DNA-binding CsgD family transcriptional regulator
MQISDERKKQVIDLYFNQHKTYAEIAQIERISPRDIHTIIKEELARRQKSKDQQQSTKAHELFSEGKTTVQVATMLKMKEYGVRAVPTTVIDGNIFYQVLPPTTGKTCSV